MGTGKEFKRMLSCGIWKEYVANRKDYCSVQICDKRGQPISCKQAEGKSFCHVSILFQDCPKDSLNLIAELLRLVASTRSEQMNKYTHNFYGFQEIIIS